LSCSGYVSLSCIVADVSYSGTFFVAPLGAQSLILDMPSLERKNPVIDWQAKTLTPRSNFSPLNPSNTSPTLSVPEPSNPSNPPVLPNLPDPHDPLKHHLPRILPTRWIDPKHNRLLLFIIADITGYKEALAAVINLDSNITPDNVVTESASAATTTTISALIPLEYAKFAESLKIKKSLTFRHIIPV